MSYTTEVKIYYHSTPIPDTTISIVDATVNETVNTEETTERATEETEDDDDSGGGVTGSIRMYLNSTVMVSFIPC